MTREWRLKNYVWLLATLAGGAAGCASEPPQRSDTAPNAQPNGTPVGNDSAAGTAATTATTDASSPSRIRDASRAPASDGRRSIVFAGTSLTAGLGLDPDSAYPHLIQRMIDSAGLRYQVVNAGSSGETSSALLARMDWLLRQPFGIFVIETGANDGLRGIPVATMRRNIQQIIDRIRQSRPEARVALVQMEAPPNLGATYTREFRATFPELARENDVVLLPFLLEGVAGVRELNQGDGIHPNMAGERIVARNVWKGLRPLLQ